MSQETGRTIRISVSLIIVLTFLYLPCAAASDPQRVTASNFGLPGLVDLPTAQRFPDGELVVMQQVHKSLARSGISFQALPRVGVSFRYSGHGIDGGEAYGRVNHDRSFDTHISIFDEGTYFPAISLGLRDFIGTGWYSSEYLVGTKSMGNLELTAGLGFGRLAGKYSFSNPLSSLSSRFDKRDANTFGRGGTLGTINWFQGDAAAFYGVRYQFSKKITISSEYTPDRMSLESSYLNVNSPWNFRASYQLNDYINLSAQYLHGSQVSVTAQVSVNPTRPPLLGGKELAPVPVRLRSEESQPQIISYHRAIRKVLAVDGFEIHNIAFNDSMVSITVKNTKFRSTAQAVGRVASTLQRFTSDDIKIADISFMSKNLVTATYRVDLEAVITEQYNPKTTVDGRSSIVAVDINAFLPKKNDQRFTWGLGPYITHRLFNPDLPLSLETGVELEAGYQITPKLKISGAVRKSVLTNLTDNNRRSNSSLPRVHSDWPLYDIEGQSGHIHELKLSYVKNLAPGLYGRAHAGLLEPFFAGVGGELLYKPAQWPIGIGIDIHRVRKRDYDMRFDLLDYETTVGHLSVYYDAGGMFDIEVNAGRYLAGDWGATTTISRKFGSGWEVGGYATLTDVPFDTFGEGSFDKAIYVSVPIDWIISSPTRSKRRLTLRPITRDGGANLFSARKLYRYIKKTQNAQFQREFGRLWR
ncbi:YjbH domain-containing protein [Rhodobacteraceae bacterium]|nr:YjbH domain-containing protein [Paracoccaceae bacterium]